MRSALAVGVLKTGREGEAEKAATAVATKAPPITSFLAHHLSFGEF